MVNPDDHDHDPAFWAPGTVVLEDGMQETSFRADYRAPTRC